MKKLTKQALLQTQQASGQSKEKKKSKTSSSSFTPYAKSIANSEMHIPMQRHSIGTNETPLAMNKNYEYFASTASGAGAQSSQRIHYGNMHKPSNSQIAPNIGGGDQAIGLLNVGAISQKSKISTLKNKAAFEKFHPSQQLIQGQMNEFQSAQGTTTQTKQQQAVSLGANSSTQGPSSNPSNSTAVMSKLSHYQKMSSGPQKRAFVRGSSKKHGTVADHGMTNQPMKQHQIHVTQLDERVKKSSSQSLIKMQAAQMIGAQIKDFQTSIREENRKTQTLKTLGGAVGKKAQDNTAQASSKLESTSSKKLIFSFKKETKQKVTPPVNHPTTTASTKPPGAGHNRRVQSHGQAALANFNLKTEQPTTKAHSPRVEKVQSKDMVESNQMTTIWQGPGTDGASSGKGGPVKSQQQQQFLHHPSLSKQYQNINEQKTMNKSRTSGLSHSSLNGSRDRDQVSIISLNSIRKSTPKFTQVLPQSAMNYQIGMSRAGNVPSKLLSPSSQPQTKSSLNHVTPSKTVSVKEKKALAASSVPNESASVPHSVKKISKLQKNQKLRLKHAQSTVQSSSGQVNMGGLNAVSRQISPNKPVKQHKHNSGNGGNSTINSAYLANSNFMADQQAATVQAMHSFDNTKISSRNAERGYKSTGSTNEQLIQPVLAVNAAPSNRQIRDKMTPKSIKKNGKIEHHMDEEFLNQFQQEPSQSSSHMTQKVAGVVSHHKKSASLGSTPGIYNMYMGQVKQLKKQRITMQKHGGGLAQNNTQPTHFINLNTDHTANLINSHASLESLKKNSSLMQSSTKIKMSVTGKAPSKLHLTLPPSQHVEKSQTEIAQESMSHDLDIHQTEPSNQPRANQVPLSLSYLQSQTLAKRHQQTSYYKSPSQILNPNSQIISSQQKLNTMSTQQQSTQQLPTKSLTIKHKQLAKAIKQHHHNMVRNTEKTNQGHGPMTAKALSSTNHHLGENENFIDRHQFSGTMSPQNLYSKIKNHSQTMSPLHGLAHTNMNHHPKRFENEPPKNIQPAEFLSERKYEKAMKSGHLDPLGQPNMCWQSPNNVTSSDPDDNDSTTAMPQQLDYVKSNAMTNIMNQDGGSKSQQISASIIKKIQNNYQVQVTNTGYDSTLTSQSASALNAITQKIKNESASVLPYLHALQEISEVYPNNNPLNTLLSQIHQGISTLILSKEDQIQQSQAQNNNTSKVMAEKDEELKQAMEQIQHLERNETETRLHVQQMTSQIDERDDKIERLEQQILDQQKRARVMYKNQMAARADRPQLDLLFDGDCSELERQSDERRKVFHENEELQAAIDELNDDMAYGKQRENKLMFFLYILKQMGYPISEVFEREIKDVPTSRFSKNFDDEYKVMHAQLWKERKEAKKEAKLVQQNGFGIDRDEILIESLAKSDRLVPKDYEGRFIQRRYSQGAGAGTSDLSLNLNNSMNNEEEVEDINFLPLTAGPVLVPEKPSFVPDLDINKVLIIKHRRAKGLSVSNMINKTDSLDHQSQSSDESLDSRGRPKRCPKPRLHKKILDQYGITTGARNILALESRVFKEKYQQLVHNSNSGLKESDFIVEDELRYSLNSQRAESMQSQRI